MKLIILPRQTQINAYSMENAAKNIPNVECDLDIFHSHDDVIK